MLRKEVIEGCLREDAESQKTLYRELLPYLNGLCGRYLNDTSHRQDILQEGFIRIFQNLSQFDAEKGKFHSWASRIVINLCLKHNKRSLSWFVRELKESDSPDFNPEVVDALSNEELIRFLKQMPAKYYEVFNLHIIDGYSHEEIAKILKIKENLSRKRLSRAREWIKKKPKSLNALLGDYRFSIG
ncbi:MAG: sigma-70 family RNA polymerase sigma factor [Bacteroidota bacterium]